MTRRDRPNNSINSLLQAAADCASALLSDDDFDSGVNEALRILGTSIDADRLGIGEQHNDPTGKSIGYLMVHSYEWLSPGTVSQVQHPKLNRISSEEFEQDHYQLVLGNHVGGLIENYSEPFRSGQEKLGVKATYAIAIMIKGQYWGIIGLDFCRTERKLCEAEIAVLKTAATCIGSAIQREHNRQEKEVAERKALLQQQKAEELQKRDRLLNITAKVAQALLNDVDLERAIAQALRIVGEGIDTDRVAVMEHYEDATNNSLSWLKMLFEWHSPHAVSQLQHPELQQVSYDGMEEWYEQLKKGKAVGGKIEEIPEAIRQGQLELGVKSTYAVPIVVEEKYWGVVGFDDCREAKQRTASEISILTATAACIGSAIQKNRLDREREQAERQALVEKEKAIQLTEHNLVLEQRDNEVQRSYRILSATAEASNMLLAEEDFDEAVNKALQIIGESIDTDRVGILEHINDSSRHPLGYVEVIYEWDSSCAISQLEHPEVSQISLEGIEEWYFKSCQGISTGGVIDELPEPFRSKMIQIGVKATYGIPILVDGKFWGFIGIDDCREVTRRSEAELSILKTAAACIGSAIQQERIRRAKEEADRNILLEREQAAIEKAEQLRESNLVLSLRDRWLEATANAANKLLEIADLDAGINAALKVLGESLDCDLVGIFKCFYEEHNSTPVFGRIIYEWNSPHLPSQMLHQNFKEISVNELGEEWVSQLIAGHWVGGIISELAEPFRSVEIELGVKSTYIVPIFINNSWWGTLSMDFSREARRLTLPEIAVFKTAASCVGSAIYRQQIQQDKEQAEQRRITQLEVSNLVLSLRDRWLEATANAANQLLATPDLDVGINAALKVLGESLDCDRVHIWQLIYTSIDSNRPELGQLIYEWKSSNISSQILHPNLSQIPVEELGEEWIAQLLSGEWVGGILDELQESFRSGQAALRVNSTYMVPFFLNETWWGTVSIDFCREARRLTLPEIAVFKTAASCVGSAIARQQIQQEKEQAELAILDERNRMAREIHDTLAQAFTGISLQLEAAKNSLTTNPEIATERLLQAKNLAKEGINEARRSVRALRPEALEFGLPTALHKLVDKMLLGTKIKPEISIEGETPSLTPEIEVELFRIAQEALTNVIRHAQATEVSIQLIYEPDTIYLQIKDNGIGFDPQQLESEGFGLLGIRERCDRLNGNLVINSAVGQGTEITITVVAS